MHDPSSVENTSPTSREASGRSEPAYIIALFGPDIESAPLPPLVSELADEISGLAGAAPAAVAAVVFATLGACLGPKLKLSRGRNCYPVGINVIVSHKAPRTLPWFDAITATFTGRVLEMQAALAKTEPGMVREEIARQKEEFLRVCNTVEPDPGLLARLKAELDRAPARLKPMVASTSALPKDLERLLPEAFDGGMTLVGVCSDPGADLLRLKAPERAHLAKLLNWSWEGSPLAFNRTVYDGHLSLLWQTRQSTKDLLGRHGFDSDFVAVPTLVFHDESCGKRIPAFVYEPLWRKFCGEVFALRCLNQNSNFTLSAEAEVALTEFTDEMDGRLANIPGPLRPHVTWLPELAARLATISTILSADQQTVVNQPTVADAVQTSKWLGRRHLMAAATAILSTDSTDHTDKTSVLLAKIRVKAPITRRDLRRCFDDQRVRWFDAALDTLIEGKKVRYDDSACLVTCP